MCGTVDRPGRFLHLYKDLDLLMNGQTGQLKTREVFGREDSSEDRLNLILSPFCSH